MKPLWHGMGLLAALLLSACGGGGDSSLRVRVIDDDIRAGASVALLASRPGVWQQAEGPTVSPSNWQQQLLAFDLPAEGDYRFVFLADSGQPMVLAVLVATAGATPYWAAALFWRISRRVVSRNAR